MHAAIINPQPLKHKAMPQLTIRKVDQDLIEKLKARAAKNGRSLEAELRFILEQVVDVGTWLNTQQRSTKRSSRKLSHNPSLELLPTPDEESIIKMQEMYKRRFDMDITLEEAGDILGKLMRFIYLVDYAQFEQNPQTPLETNDPPGA